MERKIAEILFGLYIEVNRKTLCRLIWLSEYKNLDSLNKQEILRIFLLKNHKTNISPFDPLVYKSIVEGVSELTGEEIFVSELRVKKSLGLLLNIINTVCVQCNLEDER